MNLKKIAKEGAKAPKKVREQLILSLMEQSRKLRKQRYALMKEVDLLKDRLEVSRKESDALNKSLKKSMLDSSAPHSWGFHD